MGRPKNGTSNELERVLTRKICQEVYLASGLTMAELSQVFAIGTKDDFGKYTSKTFSRYCESDPKKEIRSAPRDVLQRIVRMSLDKERNWLTVEQIRAWNLRDLLALDHESAAAAFVARKKERDALVKSLRELKKAVTKTLELNVAGKFVCAAKYESPDNDDIWQTHLRLRHLLENEITAPSDDDSTGIGDVVAPISLNGCLELLDICLEQTVVFFWSGDTDVPRPDRKRLAPRSKLPADAIDFSDLDALLELVEKSTK